MRLWSLGLLSVPLFLLSSQQVPNKSFACPQELKPLTERMLNDLPSYANRVIQRSRLPGNKVSLSSYMIVAGQPNYQPLPLKVRQLDTKLPDDTKQVFFTTLERAFYKKSFQDSQNYHWLFLTSSGGHWQQVLLYTQLGSINPNNPPLPPQESSQGVVGQAVRLWLRDCEAGSLRSKN